MHSAVLLVDLMDKARTPLDFLKDVVWRLEYLLSSMDVESDWSLAVCSDRANQKEAMGHGYVES